MSAQGPGRSDGANSGAAASTHDGAGHRPRTNGKAERFIQTSLREWAYGRPYACSEQRAQAIGPWTDDYNLIRPHSGIKGLTPWQRVNNLLGNDS